MVKCEPAKKEHKRIITQHPCFRCLREVTSANDYDFAAECASDVMVKMDSEELESLSQEVLQTILDVNTYETDWEELTLLGDCLARVFMFTLTRGHYLREIFLNHENVREVIRIAAEKSMPAYGVASLYDKDIMFPSCWLDMTVS